MKVCEVYRSLQGETTAAGRVAGFVRLAGCNLRCRWCDTRYAWTGGEEVPWREVRDRVLGMDAELVVITGGEPLLQAEAVLLAHALAGAGREVMVETNGSLSIRPLDEPVRRILDLKPPSSGMADRMLEENLGLLRDGDELKCPVADREDFDYALERVEAAQLPGRIPVLASPVAGELEPARLARWILEARRPVRLQLQLHRILWPDRHRGV